MSSNTLEIIKRAVERSTIFTLDELREINVPDMRYFAEQLAGKPMQFGTTQEERRQYTQPTKFYNPN